MSKKTKMLSQTVRRIKAIKEQDEGESTVYRNWVNWVLEKRQIQVFRLETDLADGVILCELAEALTGASLKFRKNPKLQPHKVDNIGVALQCFRDASAPASINAKDFMDGNLHAILGFLWGLIQKFQLIKRNKKDVQAQQGIYKEGAKKMSPKQEILTWVQDYLSGYPGVAEKAVLKNGAKAFKDGQLLFCLVHKTNPGAIQLEEADRIPENLINKSIKTANEYIGVPQLITSSALTGDSPNEHSLLTYLFAFRSTVEDPEVQAEMRAKLEGQQAVEAARAEAEKSRREAAERDRLAREAAEREAAAARMKEMEAAKQEKKKKKKSRDKGKFKTLGRSLKGSGFKTIRAGPQHKGVMCGICSQQLSGALVVVKHETFHNTCFVCHECKSPFTRYFWSHNDKSYCLEHFLEAADMKCNSCGQYIEDDTVTIAQDKRFHGRCFTCTTCKQPFDESYFMWKGQPYCNTHYFEAAGDICAACHSNIEGNVIAALDQKWHADCFSCVNCGTGFLADGEAKPFFAIDSSPYCPACYELENAVICGGCSKPIEGDIIAAMGAKWHQDCFVCQGCRSPFTSSYVNVGGKPFCSTCARRR